MGNINFFKLTYFLLIIIFIISFFGKGKLPSLEKISPDLLKDPIQTETDKEDFNFEYRGESYHVIPLVDYELWGLVATHNNIDSWYSYYHDKDSVNLKDICVVWGDNIKNRSYREVRFKSGEFTCFAKYRTKEPSKIFKNNQFSNNHLLSSDPKVRKIIRNIRIGDQIYIKGMLVNYSQEGSNFYRKTSLTRDDRGSGACETIYVEEIKIIKRGNALWYFLYNWSIRVFFLLIILQIYLFFQKCILSSGDKVN